MILPRAGILVLAGLLAASCGARLMKLPSGPGAPASDAAQVLTDATGACRDVSSITAEVGVSGAVAGRRVRARLIAGLETPASARLEAYALSQQIFIFVARSGDATLLLTRENRILQHGRPEEILETVAGIPLDASELRNTLLGCPPESADPAGPGAARQIGDWRVVSHGPRELYFRRRAGAEPWRLMAVVHRDPARPEWRAEYQGFESNLPRAIRLVSSDARRVDLRLVLSAVELNAKLPPAAFDVKIPPAAEPITIEELRRSGPLASITERPGAALSGSSSRQALPAPRPTSLDWSRVDSDAPGEAKVAHGAGRAGAKDPRE